MHIMHVTDTLAIGGKERMLVEIANATFASGHKVAVCVTRDNTALAADLRAGIAVHVLQRQRSFDWSAMRRFARLVKQQHVDVLHAHGRASFSFLALMKQLGLFKTPILLHDHFGMIELNNAVPRWFSLWGKRWVSHYVGVYGKLEAWAKAGGVPQDRISTIENALNLEKIQSAAEHNIKQELGIGSDVLVGIVVGNIRPEKGTDVLIEAVSQSALRGSIKILIVGKDTDEAFAAECRRKNALLNMAETVIFIGPRSDVASLLKSVDFALLPARSESGPLVLIEFMASGLPFVATRVGGIARRVDQLGAPAFVKPDCAGELTVALDELLNLSPDERAQRGEQGRQIALANFDLAQTMPQWYQIYNRLAGMAKQ